MPEINDISNISDISDVRALHRHLQIRVYRKDAAERSWRLLRQQTAETEMAYENGNAALEAARASLPQRQREVFDALRRRAVCVAEIGQAQERMHAMRDELEALASYCETLAQSLDKARREEEAGRLLRIQRQRAAEKSEHTYLDARQRQHAWTLSQRERELGDLCSIRAYHANPSTHR